ncbi:MAG: DUF1330 domain-containing protein [Gammaproteobacteria bacterium]|nr:DUF1330 domain-containing protein [Gammaproteobacteria bacterium]MDH4256108.1 DUF1330 domain-containing protein [Gammaproteobacteria bacterium]MDH5309126.1 DUF1330 domain-containing protein [Gammaproteobacteria bacterium]
MAAYIIVSYDIVDPDRYSDYVPGVLPLLLKHGAEVLVADSDAQLLEGEKRGVYVVLKFESDEAALAWYNDPEYAPVRKIRLDASANGNMVLAKAFVAPEP